MTFYGDYKKPVINGRLRDAIMEREYRAFLHKAYEEQKNNLGGNHNFMDIFIMDIRESIGVCTYHIFNSSFQEDWE